jgi:uncharacterized membrane protein
MNSDWRVEVPQLAILGAMFAMAAATWSSAPDQIPVHWNAAGDVDRYGGKFEGLLLLPLMATGMYLLLRFVPRVDPGRANYAGFAPTYALIRIATLVVMAAIYAVMHMWLRGREVSINAVVPSLIGALFIVLGATMGKLRPNWFVGIRTPWTLSSKTAWVRTHRIGGWLFILQGLALMMLVPFFEPRLAFRVLIAGAVTIALWSLVYSYIVWRGDPDKVPPAGTTPAE